MAEQTLSELVMNLINWIESLHEKNLKYEAQVESLMKDLAKAQTSHEELEARLSAYQNGDIKPTIAAVPVTNINPQIVNTIHPPHQQAIYQPIANAQSFVAQPAPYVWTYDASGHEMQVPYYEHYGTSNFQQP